MPLKIDGLCKALPPLTGDLKEDAMAMKAWRDSVHAKSKEWLHHHIQIRSDVGAKLAAALFCKGTQFIRQEVAKAPRLVPAKSILLRSAPTATHLFSDNEKVRKAMEAAEKHRPYTPKPFVPKTPYYGSGSSKSWGTGAAKTAAPGEEEGRQVPEGGKPQRPSALTSEARRPQVTRLRVAPLGEVREVVLGVVSPAQTPCIFPPFGLPLLLQLGGWGVVSRTSLLSGGTS
jgi:hypothetical protein